MKKPFITKGDDSIKSGGFITWPEVQSLLITMGQDKNIDLKKLEIRKNQNEMYHVIVKARRKQTNV